MTHEEDSLRARSGVISRTGWTCVLSCIARAHAHLAHCEVHHRVPVVIFPAADTCTLDKIGLLRTCMETACSAAASSGARRPIRTAIVTRMQPQSSPRSIPAHQQGVTAGGPPTPSPCLRLCGSEAPLAARAALRFRSLRFLSWLPPMLEWPSRGKSLESVGPNFASRHLPRFEVLPALDLYDDAPAAAGGLSASGSQRVKWRSCSELGGVPAGIRARNSAWTCMPPAGQHQRQLHQAPAAVRQICLTVMSPMVVCSPDLPPSTYTGYMVSPFSHDKATGSDPRSDPCQASQTCNFLCPSLPTLSPPPFGGRSKCFVAWS